MIRAVILNLVQKPFYYKYRKNPMDAEINLC